MFSSNCTMVASLAFPRRVIVAFGMHLIPTFRRSESSWVVPRCDGKISTKISPSEALLQDALSFRFLDRSRWQLRRPLLIAGLSLESEKWSQKNQRKLIQRSGSAISARLMADIFPPPLFLTSAFHCERLLLLRDGQARRPAATSGYQSIGTTEASVILASFVMRVSR